MIARPSPFILYLYSNKNIVGCGLAVSALIAFFTGIIHDFWPEIVAGAYAAGALVTPTGPAYEPFSFAALSTAEVNRMLAQFMREMKAKLPAHVFALVDGIVTTIRGILPILDRPASSLTSEDAFTIRETALEYLPQTIATYLRLPPAYRTTAIVSDGKTAQALLIEQLTLLDVKLREIAKNLAASDATALVANGRFLREKFASPTSLTTASPSNEPHV